jgi:hypothetical protein
MGACNHRYSYGIQWTPDDLLGEMEPSAAEQKLSQSLQAPAAIRAGRIAKCHGIDGKRLREIVEEEQTVERYSLPMLTGPAFYSPM